MKEKFTLKGNGCKFKLQPFQSPRGLRNGPYRPNKLKIKLNRTVNKRQLSALVRHLISLENSLTEENRKKQQ